MILSSNYQRSPIADSNNSHFRVVMNLSMF